MQRCQFRDWYADLLSIFLSFIFVVQALFLLPITCKGLVVDRWFGTQSPFHNEKV
jgi:hypothetical protein